MSIVIPSEPVAASIVDPKMMIETMELLGVKKARMANQKLVPLAILAGVYVGIGTTLYLTLLSEDHSPPMRVLGGMGFTTGLIMIIFVGAELFTGNCLMLMAVLAEDVSIKEMIIDLSKVWSLNFVGCIVMATLFLGMGLGGYDATVTDPADYRYLTPMGQRACAVAKGKSELHIWEMWTRGILGNMLVCLAVLQALAAKSAAGKILGMVWPISAFVVFGLEHSIANMFLFAFATLLKCPVKNHGYYWLDLVFVTIGNIMGAFFLSLMYYIVYLSHRKEEKLRLSRRQSMMARPLEDAAKKDDDVPAPYSISLESTEPMTA